MFINGSIFLGRITRTSLLILTSFFLLIGLFLLPSPGLYAAQVTLAWDPETDPNVAGYKVYYGTASRSYQFNNDAGKNTTSTVSNLQTGTTYYFAVTAYDAADAESGYSNEVSYAVATCQYTLSPTSQSIGASGGSASTGISTQTGCIWTAVSNAPSWLTIPSTTSGTGSGTVSYSVAANSATTSRTGTMTIGGQTFTVNQAGSLQYSITASADSNGSISPQGTVTVNSGASQSFTIIPNSGYQVADVKVDGNSVGALSSYLFGNVVANHTIQTSFKFPTTYTLSVTKSGTGSGTVNNSVSGTSFNAGTVVTLTATPDAGSIFAGWSGGCSGASPTCAVTMNSDTSVAATFALQVDNIDIIASAGAGGSISPSGTVAVSYDSSQSFTINPNRGYKTINVTVDGVSIGPVKDYLFGNIRGNHKIDASFGPLPGNRKGWR